MADGDMAARKAELICSHITALLKGRQAVNAPLVIGVQGPQGSGKTTVTSAVQAALDRQGKRTAVFSIDDLYLDHDGLEELKRRYPDNRLLHGRGQPGTHDMALGTQLLTDLRANDRSRKVKIPIFDKSMFSGEGDRSKETTEVVLPLDVVIFEGWCLGFYPLEEDSITQRYDTEKKAKSKPYFLDHSLASLLQINSLLRQYLSWYRHIDAFVLLQPDDLHNVFAWRLQAEHAMKATGKTGMTDEQVHTFVARYMPGYELFGDGPRRRDAPWHGKGLVIEMNKDRDMVGSSNF